MKRKRKNNLRLLRPADACLPASLLISAVMGRGALVTELYFCYMVVKILGLATPNGARIAFAEQPTMKSVCGSVKTALLAQLAGGLLAQAFIYMFCKGVAYADIRNALVLFGLGTLLNIEHVFYEYLYATGDGSSATLCRLITSLLTAAGILLSSPSNTEIAMPRDLRWLGGTIGLATLVSVVIGIGIGGPLRGKMNARVLKCAPRSMLQSLFYPISGYLAFRFRPFGESFFTFFCGLTVYELCRTPFRRSAMESRSMNSALLIICGAAMLLQLACLPNWMLVTSLGSLEPLRPILEDTPLGCYMVIVGCICAFAMFGSVSSKET